MRRRGAILAVLLACGGTSPPAGTPDASDASVDVTIEAGATDAPADVTAPPDVVDVFHCGTITPTGSTATTYQIDARHDGVQPSDHLALPLCKRWTVPLAGEISYPVVAGGRVFVTVADLDGGLGTDLYALDQKTGALLWGPVTLTSQYPWSALTYDAGRLFALDSRGMLTAFDPATGKKIWLVKSPATYVASPPTAWGGRIYFSGNTGVCAFDELDGTLGWTALNGGDDSSPAVDLTGVYVSYPCDQAYSLDPSTGALNWHHSGPCSGGGGSTPALHAGVLFVRDYFGNLMLDTSTGVSTGSFYPTQMSPAIPAFVGQDTLLRVANGAMDAWQFTQQKTLWSFAGDGKLVTAPLVASSTVVVGSSAGEIYVVDATTGTLVSSDGVGLALPSNESGGYGMTTGFAIADGMLFVPASGALVAY